LEKFIEIADDKEDPIYYLGKVGEKYCTLQTYGNMVDYKSGGNYGNVISSLMTKDQFYLLMMKLLIHIWYIMTKSCIS
jgi:hypothetical protein